MGGGIGPFRDDHGLFTVRCQVDVRGEQAGTSRAVGDAIREETRQADAPLSTTRSVPTTAPAMGEAR